MTKKAFGRGGAARVLIDSACDDAPPPGAFERELERLGLEARCATPAVNGAETFDRSFTPGTAFAKASLPAQLLALIGAIGIAGALFSEPASRHEDVAPKTFPSVALPSLPSSAGDSAPTGVVARIEILPVAPLERSAPPLSTIVVSDLPDAPRTTRASAPSTVSAARPSPPVPEPPSGSLAEEIAALDRARAAIARSPDDALALLEAHARQYPKTPFREEAALVRVEALLSAGRRTEAERVAEPYLREQEAAPVARRMRRRLDDSRGASKP